MTGKWEEGIKNLLIYTGVVNVFDMFRVFAHWQLYNFVAIHRDDDSRVR